MHGIAMTLPAGKVTFGECYQIPVARGTMSFNKRGGIMQTSRLLKKIKQPFFLGKSVLSRQKTIV